MYFLFLYFIFIVYRRVRDKFEVETGQDSRLQGRKGLIKQLNKLQLFYIKVYYVIINRNVFKE